MKETTQRIANQDQFHPFAAAMAAAYELALASVSLASPTDEERVRDFFAQLQKEACVHAPTVASLQAEVFKLRSEVQALKAKIHMLKTECHELRGTMINASDQMIEAINVMNSVQPNREPNFNDDAVVDVAAPAGPPMLADGNVSLKHEAPTAQFPTNLSSLTFAVPVVLDQALDTAPAFHEIYSNGSSPSSSNLSSPGHLRQGLSARTDGYEAVTSMTLHLLP